LLPDALFVLAVEELAAGAELLAAGWLVEGAELDAGVDAGVEDVAPASAAFFDFLLFFACVVS
jgi:hypothetical protein